MFNIVPSRIEDFLWQHTHDDILSSIELKLSYENAIVLQNYENLLLTAQAVFGKKGGDGAPVIDDKTIIADTADEIEMAFRALGWTSSGG